MEPFLKGKCEASSHKTFKMRLDKAMEKEKKEEKYKAQARLGMISRKINHLNKKLNSDHY